MKTPAAGSTRLPRHRSPLDLVCNMVDERSDDPKVGRLLSPALTDGFCIARAAGLKNGLGNIADFELRRVLSLPVEKAAPRHEFCKPIELVFINAASILADPWCEHLAVPR